MGKRTIVITTIIFGSLLIGQSDDTWVSSLPKPYTLTEDEISELLPLFKETFPNYHDRLRAFALWRVGTPYEIFKLGEEVEPDPDPIIRMDVSDCTGHVLTCMAFTHSNSWDQAKERMIDIHYKADPVGLKQPTYLSRWHYTLDRISHNPYTVNITETLLPYTKLKPVQITLNRQKDDTEFLKLDWEQPMDTFYIPSKSINQDLLSRLPKVCGVAFVRTSYMDKGILIAHEGMIIDKKYVLHASSTAGETVKLPFMDYYFTQEGPLFDGVMIYSFQEMD